MGIHLFLTPDIDFTTASCFNAYWENVYKKGFMKKFISLIIIALIFTGCAQRPDPQPKSANYAPETDPAQAKLSEAAASVSRSLIALAEIQEASTPPPKSFHRPDPSAYGMANLVSINWSGPIGPLVNQIAKATGYKVRVLGKAPAIPVMIALNAQNKPIGDVLTNVGYQAGNKADIIVYPNSHTIELRYARS